MSLQPENQAENQAERPAKDDKPVSVSFRIPRPLKERAEQVARDDHRSVASLVVIAISEYLEKRPAKKQKRKRAVPDVAT